MKRRLFNLLAGVSLVLCVATAGLWVWSSALPVWRIRMATPAASIQRELALGGGYVAVSTVEMLGPIPKVGAGYPYGGEAGGWSAMGLQWHHERMELLRPKDRTVLVVLNRSSTFSVWLGLPLLLSAVLPAWWLIRYWKINREKRKGTCRICGYDLRATPDRCPDMPGRFRCAKTPSWPRAAQEKAL